MFLLNAELVQELWHWYRGSAFECSASSIQFNIMRRGEGDRKSTERIHRHAKEDTNHGETDPDVHGIDVFCCVLGQCRCQGAQVTADRVSTRTPLHGLYDSSYDFHEQAGFLQLSVPVFGSTISSVSCGNSDAVVKVKTELVALNRRIMFVFQRRYSFPCLPIPVFGSTIYSMPSNVFDVGV